VTKSADQEHASPSSSFPAYVFEGPAQVAIRARTNDQPRYVDTRLSVWTWYDGGMAMNIDWSGLKLNSEFIEIAKSFMVHTLEKYSPSTAYRAARMLHRVSESDISLKFPWAANEIISAFNSWNCSREYVVVFRTLYRWARDRGITGFSNDIYLRIKDFKTERSAPYSRIFLSQSGLELDEEIRLLKRIERKVPSDNWVDAQFNMMLHLSFELGPRSIQFHSLEIADFEVPRSGGSLGRVGPG